MVSNNHLDLFKDRRFLPIFIVQFCGCLNDNILKGALIIALTYQMDSYTSVISSKLLILLVSAVFILPYLIFAGIAGQVADKFNKAKVVQIIKLCEIFIVFLGIYGFYIKSISILIASIGLMGIHSTFFGTIKYSILPEQLYKNELLSANALIETFTFIGILSGTLLGGLSTSAMEIVWIIMFVASIVGFVASLYIIPSENVASDLVINKNIFAETLSIISYSCQRKQILLSILGISWFWFIGACFMNQIPTLIRDVFYANENVANMFLAVFSIGLGCGSMLCSKLLNEELSTKYVFLSTLGISVFCIDIAFASAAMTSSYTNKGLIDIGMFLSNIHNIRIVLDLFCIAILSGMYSLPLYTLLQSFCAPMYRSRVIAANNVINALFMVLCTIMLAVLVKINVSVHNILFIISILNAAVALYIYVLLQENIIIPHSLVFGVGKFLISLIYKIEVRGIDNFYKAGKKAVIIANHISYLDPPLLAAYLPERVGFAINASVAQEWWIKPFIKIGKNFMLDTNNAMSLKGLINEVRNNRKIVIFPEGRISTTGTLMKVYDGPAMIADKAEANILPIRIEGTQYTVFSKMKHAIGRHPRNIVITILPPVRLDAPSDLDARARRKYTSARLYDIMSDMMFESSAYKTTIYQSLIDAATLYGKGFSILQDMNNPKLSYRSLMTKSFVIGNVISSMSDERENVGLMLANSCAAVIVFFGMQLYSRVPTMINFTSGVSNILSSCKTSGIKTIYSSRFFVEQAGLESLVRRLIEEGYNVVYLEDLRDTIKLTTKLLGVVFSVLPQLFYDRFIKVTKDYNLPAVVLFTSGTEGAPKAVVLSHLNLQSNRYQVAARVAFGHDDIAFNALPVFHSFGLSVGTLLPILFGIKTFMYPSPLHYRVIPEMIYDAGATIFFGTDTFLNGYAKFAHSYDFYSIRYVFAGSEKLRDETMRLWFDNYGIRILQGYGVTEASPVVAVNTPMHYKAGSVGRVLPKLESFVLPVDGIEYGGRLCIKGPNIMLGYMFYDNPGVIVAPKVDKLGDGWYDTGDIVNIDTDGYITIYGRVKRFAKLAGEMVSLGGVEDVAHSIDSDAIHGAIVFTDHKGEKIVLFTTSTLVIRDSFVEALKKFGHRELMIPKEIILLDKDAFPLLGSGKVDYQSLDKKYTQEFRDNLDK